VLALNPNNNIMLMSILRACGGVCIMLVKLIDTNGARAKV
jgi:hypothetical protein